MRPIVLLRIAAAELLASMLLVTVVFGSGLVRLQLGTKSMGGALLGSTTLGLGYGLLIWTFSRPVGIHTNPFVSVAAWALGGQAWLEAAVRICAQVCGALLATMIVAGVPPFWTSHGTGDVSAPGIVEAVAGFGFVLVALCVAARRSVEVPMALGTFAMASFWMTGNATVGNPLLVLSIFLARGDSDIRSLATSLGGALLGAGLGTGTALLLIPRTREAARCLLFVPRAH